MRELVVFEVIEEMFENGRRKQVLFALLNYRIIIVYLNNFATSLSVVSISVVKNLPPFK